MEKAEGGKNSTGIAFVTWMFLVLSTYYCSGAESWRPDHCSSSVGRQEASSHDRSWDENVTGLLCSPLNKTRVTQLQKQPLLTFFLLLFFLFWPWRQFILYLKINKSLLNSLTWLQPGGFFESGTRSMCKICRRWNNWLRGKAWIMFFPPYFIQDNRYNNVQTFIYRHGQRGYQKIACLYYCAVRHSLIVASYSNNILFGTKNRCWSWTGAQIHWIMSRLGDWMSRLSSDYFHSTKYSSGRVRCLEKPLMIPIIANGSPKSEPLAIVGNKSLIMVAQFLEGRILHLNEIC